MDHYFSDNSKMPSNPKMITYVLNDKEFIFKSDQGVFSKNYIDFGTRVLLSEICKHHHLNKKVLDLGCGYGVIGIVLKHFFDIEITMVDVNPRAVQLTIDNVKRNGIDAKVIESNVYENIHNQLFQHIICNPPIRAGKAIVNAMIIDAIQYLEASGSLWIVMQKKQGALTAIKNLENAYDHCEILRKEKGYYIVRAKKSVDRKHKN